MEEGVDEVALTSATNCLWVAWSRSRLDREEVALATVDVATGEVGSARHRVAGFRPALTSVEGEAVLVAAAADHVEVVRADVNAVTSSKIPTSGPVHRVAVAPGTGEAWVWLAWDERSGADMRVVVAALDRAGGWHQRHTLSAAGRWYRSPALASDGANLWVACVESGARAPGTVALRRLDGRELARVALPGPRGVAQEAPCLTSNQRGDAVVAWHARAACAGSEPLLRWPSLAIVDGESLAVTEASPPLREFDRAGASEDQGWEMAAVAAAGEHIWLAGRSSNGFWVAQRGPAGEWSERSRISSSSWGGHGTRLGLAVCGDKVFAARREPDGIVVSGLVAPPPAGPAVAQEPGRSAPLLRLVEDSGYGVLFGDLHCHSAHSDGLGTLEDLWSDARVRGLDFAAVTDHDQFCGREIGPLTWSHMCQVADAYDDPGRFAAVSGFEFTGARSPGPGHKCVYFAYRRPDRLPEKDVAELHALLREYDGIAVPHHVGWTGSDLERHDPVLQPLWEMCSVHGSYEGGAAASGPPPRADVVLAGHFIRDALDGGARFGFVGGSDSHGLLWHHGISAKRDPFATGLAGVVGAQPERASIFSALRRRSVYATTGARILLDVSLDGAPMGSELAADTRGALEVSVRGEGRLAHVELISPDRTRPVDGIDGAALHAVLPVAKPADRAWTYFYLRVTQADGEMAWSSPIWLG